MPEMLAWYSKVIPVTPWEIFNKEGNLYTFYEDLNMHGYIALGDSVCNFNPVYAQGITCAAEAVLLLDVLLRSGKRGTSSLSIL